LRYLLLFSLLFLSACSTKEYKLFQQENNEHQPINQELNITISSKIMPNDVLQIDIYNMNRKSNIMVSDKGSAPTPDNKFIVYEDGTIILPLLNVVNVQGLTIKELNSMLDTKYRKYLKAPYVKASVKNHKVYVLGEVTKKGAIPIEGETISVIEAISRSGGLTDYALRDRIRIINEHNGKFILSTINLTKFDTLNSRNLMLTNNSIVYIEPKNTKAISVTINDYLPILKVITNIISPFVSIKYLTN